MSFSRTESGTVENVLKGFEADKTIPDEAVGFIEKALKPYEGAKVMILARAYGHLFDGSNHEVSSLNITVQKTNEIHPSFLNQDAKPNEDTISLKVTD